MPLRHSRKYAVLGIVAACLFLLLGCSNPDATELPEASEPKLTVMPDLRGKTLAEASEIFGSWDFEVTVVFPSVTATAAIEATRAAGAYKPAHVEEYVLPERRRGLDDVAAFTHVIETQMPLPGSTVSREVTFGVTPGSHPNRTGQRWLPFGHVTAVKREGAAPCFACHSPHYCATCHTRLLD